MKQVETEIEYEEVEHEVERIYCDECGSEATDRFVFEPRHVCHDCRSDPWYESITDLPSTSGEFDGDTDMGLWVFAALIWPLFLFASIGDAWDDGDDAVARAFASASVGTALWGGLVLLLLTV